MQKKGTLIICIADTAAKITEAFEKWQKQVKNETVLNDKEKAFIMTTLSGVLQESNAHLEQVKKLLSPKQGANEKEQLELLQEMFASISVQGRLVEKFEKGFAELVAKRGNKADDLSEVKQLFRIRAKPAVVPN